MRLGSLPVTFRYRLRMPLTGMFFSPQYGELYYEIYLGNRSGLVRAAWPGNFLRLDNLLSADLHFGATTLRLGYRLDYSSSKASHIVTRRLSHCAVVGITCEWISLGAGPGHTRAQNHKRSLLMPRLFRSLRNAAAKQSLPPLHAGPLRCHSIESWDNDVYGNFDALWTIMDTHYCFFREKGIDWEETGQRYRRQLKPDMDATEFFGVCADMLAELRDGHTNLSSWFDVSYYRQWWSDYPQNFNLRLIQENYLGFDYHSGGPIIYKILEDENIGYMHYSTFAADYGMAFLDNMLYSMRECDALIIDVRDNGGGNLTVVDKLVEPVHRPDNNRRIHMPQDRSGTTTFPPFAYTIEPATGHVRWLKPWWCSPTEALSARQTTSLA